MREYINVSKYINYIRIKLESPRNYLQNINENCK